MKPGADQSLNRRQALAGAGVAGAVAAVAAVAPSLVQPDAQPVAAADKVADDSAQAGYHVTEHIKRYYSTART